MFEDLDKIDWKSIHHSHGTAEKFPEWLRTLATGDDKEWEYFGETEEGFWEEPNAAYYYISEFSNHQGSICEVTPILLPFILELLKAVSEKRQVILLSLLDRYAGGPYHESDSFVRQIYEQRGTDFDAEIRSWNSNVTRTRTQLLEKLPLFESFLQSQDTDVRRAAEYLIDTINSHPPM